MSRNKAKLLKRDHYGRHLAAARCTELIVARLAEGPGPVELRVEDPRYAPWDDLTEVRQDALGHRTEHVWQVKRQLGPLKRGEMDGLRDALVTHPGVTCHLGLYTLVDLVGVGPLGALAELCERLREDALEPGPQLELSQPEKAWIAWLQERLRGTEQEVWDMLRRLEVHPLGPETDIRLNVISRLDRYFEDASGVQAKLLSFLAEHTDAAIPITYTLLERKVLQGFPQRLVSGSPSARSLQRAYLEAIIAGYQRLRPLRFLSGVGTPQEAGPRLAEVFAMPALQGTSEGISRMDPSERLSPAGTVFGTADDEGTPSIPSPPIRTGDVRLHELLRDDRQLAERPRFHLEGSVGTGKSTLLEHLSFLLAERARDEPVAPLPVRLDARELSKGLTRTVEQGHPSLDHRLLQAHPGGFIYLVDGLDEVEQGHARAVEGVLHELDQHRLTVGMVVAGRPLTTYVQVPAGFSRLQVVPWTRMQVEEFLGHWRQQDPRAVTALGGPERIHELLPMLVHPLTATFVLVLAHEDPRVLKSRAGLFQGIARKLFREWARARAARDGAPVPTWKDAAPALRMLALESVKTGREVLTLGELHRLFSREMSDEAPDWVETAHRRFGLLVRQPDTTYRFVLKGLAEHLAGAALLEEGRSPAELRALAVQRWAEEPIRHAIGLGAERHGEAWALEAIRALLPGSGSTRVDDIRPLRVAALAAMDLGTGSAVLKDAIVKPLCQFLTTDTSVWVQETVADVVRALALRGGIWRQALFQELQSALANPVSTSAWFAAQKEASRDQWLDLLRHRDSEARCVAIDKLASHVDDLEVRASLIEQMRDDSQPHFMVPPALRAALVLRHATRDASFAGFQPYIVDMLHMESGLMCGAAASALRPGEADTGLLVSGLKRLAGFGWVDVEVTQELAASPEGEAALDEGWPQWREACASMPKESPVPEPAAMWLGSRMPPRSRNTRRVVLQALRPAMEQDAGHSWVQGEQFQPESLTLEACAAAWQDPGAAIRWLQSSERLFLSQDAELILAEAVARHPSLRLALFERWKRQEDRSQFPGGALSKLVEQGDDEAATLYAEWLRVTIWLRMAFTSLIFWPTALRHRLVRPVAIEKAFNTWREFEEGTLQEGRRVLLSGNVMASVLGALRPAWEETTDLKARLFQLAREGDANGLTYALRAFATAPHPRELEAILVERFDLLSQQVREELPWLVSAWIEWASRASMVMPLQTSLERIRSWPHWQRYLATWALMEVQPERAAWLSSEDAKVWPAQWSSSFLRRSILERLVRAHPQAWKDRLLEVLDQDSLPVKAIFVLARELCSHLEASARKEVLDQLHVRLIKGAPPRWMKEGRDSGDSISFADIYARLLFEADGLPQG
ncbi:NACHT domain-containing protein [Corallococcus exiguus]|uniref:NACHT domain-containing protein n=1 Tax=Corallococcus exiguus TaxID=83462 RepID=UPI001494266C|nr:hypothetical protein [Corallococcus exiguus]NPD28815.1 hypothetical protein [Corallococcus exiguus]